MIEVAEHLDSLKYLSLNKSFLGREFLTWLWFLTESNNHIISVPKHGDFKLFIDDRIILSANGGSVLESSLKGGTPAYAEESTMALKMGKLLQEAKFVLQNADHMWSWTFRADDLTLRGLRLPAVQEADAIGHINGRLQHLTTINEVLESLYGRYLAIRTSQDFIQTCKDIAHWIAEK